MNFPEKKIDFCEKLYLPSADTIVQILATIPDWVENCLLVGHNPGLTELVNHWGIRLDNLPTASTACFSFDGDKWSDSIEKSTPAFEWIKLAKDL
ncbi:MAG: SixA phosphatase family protein [Paludibacteraceae bacterium]